MLVALGAFRVRLLRIRYAEEFVFVNVLGELLDLAHTVVELDIRTALDILLLGDIAVTLRRTLTHSAYEFALLVCTELACKHES